MSQRKALIASILLTLVFALSAIGIRAAMVDSPDAASDAENALPLVVTGEDDYDDEDDWYEDDEGEDEDEDASARGDKDDDGDRSYVEGEDEEDDDDD